MYRCLCMRGTVLVCLAAQTLKNMLASMAAPSVSEYMLKQVCHDVQSPMF